MANLLPDMRTYLLSLTTITATVTTNGIECHELSQNRTYPAIVLQKIADAGSHTLDGADGFGNITIQVSALSREADSVDAYGQADALREVIRLNLDGYGNNYFGSTATGTFVHCCHKEGISDVDYIEDGGRKLYQCSADYRVMFRETIPTL